MRRLLDRLRKWFAGDKASSADRAQRAQNAKKLLCDSLLVEKYLGRQESTYTAGMEIMNRYLANRDHLSLLWPDDLFEEFIQGMIDERDRLDRSIKELMAIAEQEGRPFLHDRNPTSHGHQVKPYAIVWPDDFFEAVSKKIINYWMSQKLRAEAGWCCGQPLFWAPGSIAVQEA